MTTWPHWPPPSVRTTSCSTSVRGAASSPWPQLERVLDASMPSRRATSPGSPARVFEVNGVQDRVTLVPGWSRQIELPEPADLLVAEVIGNEPLEEEILETTLDARQRLLKPGARLIPHTLTLFARAVLLPEAECRQRTFGRAAVERWRGLYDIDFQPLLDVASPNPLHTITEGEIVATWPQVGSPAVLASLDLTSFEEPSVRAKCRPRGRAAGRGQRGCDHVPCRSLRRHLTHARSLVVAVVELGDVGVGASRSRRSRAGLLSAGGLPPPGSRSARRYDVRGRACRIGIVGTGTRVHNRIPLAHTDWRRPWEWYVDGRDAGR